VDYTQTSGEDSESANAMGAFRAETIMWGTYAGSIQLLCNWRTGINAW
jgi:hypothetical protein